jgi:hypothetical protein
MSLLKLKGRSSLTYAMEAYRGVVVELQSFLTSALGELSDQLHTSDALPPGENPLVRRVCGLRGILDISWERKIFYPLRRF